MMPKDKWDKLKVISDVIKDNKLLFMFAISACGSFITNASQYMTNSDLEISKQKAIHEVAKGFQSAIAELEPKPQKAYNCGKCSILLKSHIKEFH